MGLGGGIEGRATEVVEERGGGGGGRGGGGGGGGAFAGFFEFFLIFDFDFDFCRFPSEHLVPLCFSSERLKSESPIQKSNIVSRELWFSPIIHGYKLKTFFY